MRADSSVMYTLRVLKGVRLDTYQSGRLWIVSPIPKIHLFRNMAHSNPHNASSMPQVNAWVFLMYSTPSFTKVPSTWVECSAASNAFLLRFNGGTLRRDVAIWTGSQESRARALPKLRQLRIYARLNNVVDVKGNGPFGSVGSKLDSGVLCQAVVHLRRAFLTRGASCKCSRWNWHLKEARVPTYSKVVL